MSARDRRRYRRLLTVFPRDVREAYGAEMEESFLRLLSLERERRGRMGAAAAWVASGLDALRGGLAERIRRLLPFSNRLGDPRHGQRPGGNPLGGTLGDVRLALRGLARRPAFAGTAILTLAIGIGATTAIFSVFNGLILRPLPYDDADALVYVWAEHLERGWSDTDVNLADAWDWRSRSGVFEDLAVFHETSLTLTGADRPERVEVVVGTSTLLPTLGVSPARGRALTADDSRPDAPLSVLLMDAFWARRFARDPEVLGRTILLDDEPATIVGVMGPDFAFLDERPDLLLPLRLDPATAERGHHNREAIGRLLPGVDVDRATRAINDVALRLQAEHPEQNEGWTASVEPLRDEMLGGIAKQASFVMMGAVAFVLLMACVNVGFLVLARANGRRAELAVRAALGAGRARLLRQLVTESLALAAAGGALGVLLAYWGSRGIVAGLPADLPAVFDLGVDGSVLGFAGAVSVLSAVLFGLVPALRLSRATATDLREGGRAAAGGASRRSRRSGGFLVVAQTALAVVLLTGGGVMIRSVAGLASQDLGFATENVLTLRLSPPESRYPSEEELRAFYAQVLEGVGSVQGVEHAGAIHTPPLGGSNWSGSWWLEGEEDPAADPGRPARFDYISPGYLEAMRIGVVDGRAFGTADGPDAPHVAMVNESFVERFLEGRDPVGLRLRGTSVTLTVVGVVKDHLERGIDRPPEPTLFFPLAQHSVRERTLVMSTAGEPGAFAEAVQQAVWAVDADQSIHQIRTMREWVDYRVGGFLILAQIMGVFAAVALALGAVGIYGVTAYAVSQRTSEIGVRLALGAERGALVRMVLRRSLLRAGAGLALGLVLALVLTGAMTGILVGVGPRDPATVVGVVVTLSIVSFLGAWLPARRASAVDPVRALAAE